MEDDAPIIRDDAPFIRDDVPFIRDEENEDRMQAIICDIAAGPNSDGEESSSEEDDEDFSAKCLNDSGEGLELENIRDDDDDEQVPLDNSVEKSGEVYIKSC